MEDFLYSVKDFLKIILEKFYKRIHAAMMKAIHGRLAQEVSEEIHAESSRMEPAVRIF